MAQPQRLGKYEILEVIGKGAMGVVYKAFDPNIRRSVAIKTVRRELMDDERAVAILARFKNEAQAAGRLSHPGIVGVFEYAEDSALAYIAMEYVEGNSLREYFMRERRFGAGDAVSLMAQLLEALGYAHAQGVWHRDIKPANLIITTNGKLKVADFGIARIDSSSLTQIGAVMGTPGYMAPEQYAGEAIDWRADLFASGVVLYQLLTGVKPFEGSAESIAYKVCHQTPPPPSRVAKYTTVPPAYDSVVARAMSKKPADRFQDAHEFRAALLDAYAAPVSPALSEETVMTEVMSKASKIESTKSLAANPPTPTPGRTTEAPPGWDASLLKEIETHYARFVGPVAKVLVRRIGRETTELDELYARLAEKLSTAQEQAAFQATRRSLSSTLRREPTTGSGGALTTEAIDVAQHKLTPYVGPIAKVLVKRAAARTSSARQFYLLLAESVSEPERARFLQDCGVKTP